MSHQRKELDELTPKKNRMTVEKFFQQFNTLDTNNYGSWPIAVKITCWIVMFLLVCVIGYFLAIKPKQDSIDRAKAQETNLLNEFREKDSKLRNLQQYQVQLQRMEMNFNEQLQQLPKETEIPNLVEDINLTGVSAGLKFKNIRLESEVQQEFFIEQPISIEATGEYHAFGRFVSGIAALSRIVTLHDFVIASTPSKDKKSDIPEIAYTLKAKTYRYIASSSEDTVGQAAMPADPAVGGQQP